MAMITNMDMHHTMVRLATVKATGRRYVVQQLDIPRDTTQPTIVRCWGDVVGYKGTTARPGQDPAELGASTTHAKSIAFTRDAVDIAEVKMTGRLAHELFRQTHAVRGLRDPGPMRIRNVRR